MKIKFALLACLAGFVSLTTLPLHADTMSLVSVGGESAGGEYIYPYNFSVDGASQLTALMCINLNRSVTFGESWNVNIGAIGLDSSQASIDQRADAWIFSQLGAQSTADVQYAVWDVLDPSGASASSSFTAESKQLVVDGMKNAQNTTLINSGFFSKYDVYTSTSNQSGWTAGQPQDYIGVAQTPEPSGLVLLGTGFIGAVAALKARQRNKSQAFTS